MKRRDFLKGSGGLIAAGLAAPAAAAEIVHGPLQITPCLSPSTRVRRNIYSLYNTDPDHPIIAAYRQGVKVMKDRSMADPNDPTGWVYHASIHGTYKDKSQWPPNAPFGTAEHHNK